jgi:lysyl-tRNA synthetase class 2
VDAGADWRPAATSAVLRRRAALLGAIRAFFTARGVMEVDTPALSATVVPESHIEHFVTRYHGPAAPQANVLYLLPSPEGAMKRLLAADSGPIYQICHVYRNGERGKLHSPEFTLLEWYRPGFDHVALMEEVDALLREVLATPPGERLIYREAFQRHTGIDPFEASIAELQSCTRQRGYRGPDLGRDACLDLLMGEAVGPSLGLQRPAFVYDYPASQAALARVRVPFAERFEVYLRGLELANGFHELADAAEQRRRFLAQQSLQEAAAGMRPPMDERLLAALRSGLPDCAGVALGIDRLLMCACAAAHIDEVMTFPLTCA